VFHSFRGGFLRPHFQLRAENAAEIPKVRSAKTADFCKKKDLLESNAFIKNENFAFCGFHCKLFLMRFLS